MNDKPTARFWHQFDALNGGDGSLPRDLGIGPARAKRTNAKPEQGIVVAVLALLRTHPRVAWAAKINSGAYKTPDGRFIRFGFVGCPDILGQMKDGRIVMIECKSDKGRLTDDQEFMLAKVRANNGVSGVARSIEDAIRIVEKGA